MFALLTAPTKATFNSTYFHRDHYPDELCKNNLIEIANAFRVGDLQWPEKHLADHTLEILLSALIGGLLMNNKVTPVEEEGIRKLLQLLKDKGIRK